MTEAAPTPKNHVHGASTVQLDAAGADLSYARAMGRHLSLGASFEYVYPRRGFGRTQGFGESIQLSVWPLRPFRSVYFGAEMTLGHHVLVAAPELNQIWLGGGAFAGWSWWLPFGVNLGFTAGLRRFQQVRESPQICTFAGICPYAQASFVPRFTVTFGYRF